MSKVYVLIGGCITDKHVIGVFSSAKKAKEEKSRIIKTDNYYKTQPDDLEIDTFILNTSIYNNQ